MSYVAAVLAATAAFLLIAASMLRHQVELFGTRLPLGWRGPLKLAGFALLIVLLMADAAAVGAARAIMSWCGQMMLGAVAAVTVLKIAAPRWAHGPTSTRR